MRRGKKHSKAHETLTPDEVVAQRRLLAVLDKNLTSALKTAVEHSRAVLDRRTFANLDDSRMVAQMQSWKSRAGFFVVSLRRELSPFLHKMHREGPGTFKWQSLCRFLGRVVTPPFWKDIGSPREDVEFCWQYVYEENGERWDMSLPRLKELMGMSLTDYEMKFSTEYRDPWQRVSDQVSADLAKLEQEVYSLGMDVRKAERINSEAADVLDRLVALAETIPPEEE